ncbi:MAG TPA: P1 family peptidase [Gemmatimonadaceae bacterium]|nr:P1 family peptidase [Gemmatimonadaceae bacterium]
MSADLAALGIAVGHATDIDGATGLTVVRGLDGAFRCAAAVIGRATGTRELHAASPFHLVDSIDAVVLTGGSAYGLDATAGAMRWMEERGRGHPVNGGVVPIIPAAVVFDLKPLGSFSARPTPAMAYEACESARSSNIAEGSVGAGTGATVGKAGGIAGAMKGGVGIGMASAGAVTAAAIAVVNALGDVRNEHGAIIAGARDASGAFADGARLIAEGGVRRKFADTKMQNTTIAVVATSACLARVELSQLAQASSAALFRRITPTGTSFDGDVIFAICPLDGPTAPSPQVEGLAVAALEQAVERAVRLAVGREGIPGLADGGAQR